MGQLDLFGNTNSHDGEVVILPNGEEFNTIRSRSNKNFFILLAVNVALFAAIAALIMIR
jgi:hypothetical protein